MNKAALSLWTGQTVHKRFVPFERQFSYKLVLIDLDIDRLDVAGKAYRFFAVNRPAVFSFRTGDHGPRSPRAPLRPWAEEQFAKAGVDLGGGTIRLVTFARHLFYKFAPISLWYGYDAAERLRGIIYEVNNTFGERHCYVAAVDSKRAEHVADKALHVSPFFDVTGQYAFTLRDPDNVLDVVVTNIKDGTKTHMANIKARRVEASDGALLSLALRNPLSSLGVTAAIHWQALRLWLRGAKYHAKPGPPSTLASVATTRAAVPDLSPQKVP